MAELRFNPRPAWDDGVREYLSNAYGAQHFAAICDSLARPSAHCCIRVNCPRATVDEVISELLDRFGPESGNENADKICFKHPELKNVVILQGEGPFQVDYDGHVRKKIVVVSRKCAESVLRGAEVFVPGVLACSEHVHEGDEVAVLARIEVQDANGKWSNGITRGTTVNSLSELGDNPNDWFIGKGRARLSRTTLFRETRGVAVEMTSRVYKLPSFHGLLEGKIFLQNLPSVVTALVLDPRPGERILDMCAAPGGKTTAIASLMGNSGEVIALDRSHNKVVDILNLANELGLTCIRAYKMDALKCLLKDFPSCEMQLPRMDALEEEIHSFITSLADSQLQEDNNNAHLTPPGGKYTSKAQERKEARRRKNGVGKGNNQGDRAECAAGFPPKFFDRVLLDAPCSALGLRPRLFAAEETLESLRRHSTYQRRMLDKAVQLVRPGGVLVYSTCTINPGENEAVVRYALDTYKFLSLAPQEPYIGGPGLVGGSPVVDGDGYREWLKEGEQQLVQRFDPSSSLDTIGFFIAKFHVNTN